MLTYNFSITCDAFVFLEMKNDYIVMYIDDEQSVRTPMTFVPPRPPPRRTSPHSSVQRDGMFAG